jgi:hypothetical protein
MYPVIGANDLQRIVATLRLDVDQIQRILGGFDGIQAGNSVVTTSGTGAGTFTFPKPYTKAPIVVGNGGNGENVVITSIGTDSFVANFFHPTGFSLNGVSVRMYWMAYPQNA